MTVSESLGRDDERYWVEAAAVPGRYLYESRGIRRGMWTVTWLRQLVSAVGPDRIDPQAVQAWLEEGARDVLPGSGGLITVPDWLAPAHAPYAVAPSSGSTARTERRNLYRSVLEGVVITMHGHAEAMEAALGRPAPRLMVSGRGAQADLVSQIAVDVYGRGVERAAVADAAGLGAAIRAAVGYGTHHDAEAAVKAMTRPGTVFESDETAGQHYTEVAAAYWALPELADPLFGRLAVLGR